MENIGSERASVITTKDFIKFSEEYHITDFMTTQEIKDFLSSIGTWQRVLFQQKSQENLGFIWIIYLMLSKQN